MLEQPTFYMHAYGAQAQVSSGLLNLLGILLHDGLWAENYLLANIFLGDLFSSRPAPYAQGRSLGIGFRYDSISGVCVYRPVIEIG